jgi:hypothetical protein
VHLLLDQVEDLLLELLALLLEELRQHVVQFVFVLLIHYFLDRET